jgi:hypothetical protein
LAELFAAMHYAVANSFDFVVAFDAAFFGIGKYVQNGTDSTLVVGFAEVQDLLRAISSFEFQEAVGESDFFNAAFGKTLLCFSID